jgi:hypothetical protein
LHWLSCLYWNFNLIDLFASLNSFYGEELVFIGETIDHGLSLKLQHVKIFLLMLYKEIHELNTEVNLFVRRCEDGIFTEIYFIFVNFKAISRVYYYEAVSGRTLYAFSVLAFLFCR